MRKHISEVSDPRQAHELRTIALTKDELSQLGFAALDRTNQLLQTIRISKHVGSKTCSYEMKCISILANAVDIITDAMKTYD